MRVKSFLIAMLGMGIFLLVPVAIAAIISGSTTTNTSSNITITTLTLAKPASTVEGDLLLANISFNGGNLANIAAPVGWTLIRRSDNGVEVGVASYWKVVGPSEATSYTWTITPQTRAVGGITRYSGVDTENPVDTSSGNSGRGTVATASSITTSAPNEQVVALFAMNAGALNVGHFSTPAGMTEKYDVTNAPLGPSTAEHDVIQVSAGASGAKSSNLPSGPRRNWIAQLIALRPASDTTLTNGLLSYWKFDESSGDAADSSGNGKTLTNQNTVAYITGKINNGGDFERDSSQYFSRSNDIYDVTTGTISCWIKMEENPSVLWIVSDKVNAGSQGFDFRINEDNKVHLSFGDGATSVLGSTSLFPGTFYMVTGTWNTSRKELFLNGVSDGADETDATMTPGNAIFKIGTREDFIENFDGIIDECGIWNRVLTQSEVTSLYNGGIGLQHPF